MAAWTQESGSLCSKAGTQVGKYLQGTNLQDTVPMWDETGYGIFLRKAIQCLLLFVPPLELSGQGLEMVCLLSEFCSQRLPLAPGRYSFL